MKKKDSICFVVGIIVFLGIAFFLQENEDNNIACTLEAKICPDGTAVSRTGPDCEFEACPWNDNEVFICDSESRLVEACIEIYDPVCASVRVECVTEPCDPINQTYSNSCFACQNSRVESFVKGEC